MITKVSMTDPLTGCEYNAKLELHELIKLLQHWQSDYTIDIYEAIEKRRGWYAFTGDNGLIYTIYLDD